MRFGLLFLGSFLIMNACTTGYPLKSVDYNDLFTDESSKVWVVNRFVVEGVDVAQYDTWSKDALIFHNNGTVDYISLKAIGNKAPKKAKFYLDSESKEITIDFKDQIWMCDLTSIQANKIVMKTTSRSDAQFTMEIVPLPEL